MARLCLSAAAFVALSCPSSILSGEAVQVIPVPGGGTVPDAEIDEGGTLHLAYLAADNIYYVLSTDGEQTFSDPIRVNTEAGFASGGRYRGPDLAVGAAGTVHVVWYNAAYQQGRPKEEWGVMYARLRPGEGSFEPSRNLNHLPSDNYALAADRQGHVAVAWMAETLFISRSEDGGDTFAAPLTLEADPCECCGSRVLFSEQESLAMLYRDKTGNNRDMYLAVLPGGEPTFRYVKLSRTPLHIEACPMTGGFLSNHGEGLLTAW